MAKENPLFFKQLLSGVDIGASDSSAQQMANFVYIIGDKNTRECVVVDPAWDIDGILKIIEAEEMKLKGSLVTHYHPDHVVLHKTTQDKYTNHFVLLLTILRRLQPLYVVEEYVEPV